MTYNKLAYIYDSMMENDIDYDGICDILEKYFEKASISVKLIADLACGTGAITRRLSNRGYDMIGIDVSDEMLCIAKENDKDSLYVSQNITEFELYGTVDAILCMIDGFNYIIDDEELQKCFELAMNYLNPDGIFIFDMSSFYKISEVLGNNLFSYEDENVFYSWDNEYIEDEEICVSDIVFFVKEDGLYRRFDEEHVQRARKGEKVRSMLEKAGFREITTFDGDDLKATELVQGGLAPIATTQRIYFVMKK